MKSLKLIACLLLISGCTEEVAVDASSKYAGHYEVVSFRSNIAVDLNNDKINSTELITEISSFGLNDLEIRPTPDQTNRTKLISFFFPKTWITFEYPSDPEGFVDFIDYGFPTTYDFVNNTFVLKDNEYVEQAYIDNVESNRTVVIASDLEVIDDDHLGLLIRKEFYDFTSKSWIMLDIEVMYERL